MNANSTSGDRADSAISKSLAPPGRAGGQAFDASRKRNFSDVLRNLPDNFFKTLQTVAPSTLPSEMRVVAEYFRASGVRPPTRGELSAEWTRRTESAQKNNPPVPAPGSQGLAQAQKRFGTKP